jgi:hypothetical protein
LVPFLQQHRIRNKLIKLRRGSVGLDFALINNEKTTPIKIQFIYFNTKLF